MKVAAVTMQKQSRSNYSSGFRYYSTQLIYGGHIFPANIYLFKVNKKSTRKTSKISSDLAINTPE